MVKVGLRESGRQRYGRQPGDAGRGAQEDARAGKELQREHKALADVAAPMTSSKVPEPSWAAALKLDGFGQIDAPYLAASATGRESGVCYAGQTSLRRGCANRSRLGVFPIHRAGAGTHI